MVVVQKCKCVRVGGEAELGQVRSVLFAESVQASACPCVQVQILGMSATIPNLPEVARWMCADVYQSDYRPVPLKEHVKVGQELYDVDRAVVRSIEATEDDPQGLAALVNEVCPDHSVLIFCATKANCQDSARALVRLLPQSYTEWKAEDKKVLPFALALSTRPQWFDVLGPCHAHRACDCGVGGARGSAVGRRREGTGPVRPVLTAV